MAQPMESGTLICKCKKVTYGMIEDAMHHHDDLGDVVKLFEEVQKETSCSTGCGTCHDKILDVIADIIST